MLNKIILCKCKHPEEKHSEKGCLCSRKNRHGWYICKCKKYEPLEQEVKNVPN